MNIIFLYSVNIIYQILSYQVHASSVLNRSRSDPLEKKQSGSETDPYSTIRVPTLLANEMEKEKKSFFIMQMNIMKKREDTTSKK